MRTKDAGVSATAGIELPETVATAPNVTACTFQIRVDGVNASGETVLDASDATTQSSGAVPVRLGATFDGLAPGPHAVSLWVRGSQAGGCVNNSGNYPREATIEETTPAAASAP